MKKSALISVAFFGRVAFGVKEWLYFSAPGSGFLIIVR